MLIIHIVLFSDLLDSSKTYVELMLQDTAVVVKKFDIQKNIKKMFLHIRH